MRRGKVYVKLFAGLGNQLFQYSYGQHLKREGRAVRYILSPSRNSLADVFDVPGGEIRSSSNPVVLGALKAYAKFVRRSWESGFYSEYRYAECAKGLLSFRRAADYRESPWFEKIASANSVAVHVRGGDYLTESGYPGWGSVCGAEYYSSAFARAESELRDAVYFVFSDDYAHAERVLPEAALGRTFMVRDEGREADAGFHMFLMGACRHNIIANSTYSWWGAFLGSREGRMVVGPARWDRFTTPPDWILL